VGDVEVEVGVTDHDLVAEPVQLGRQGPPDHTGAQYSNPHPATFSFRKGRRRERIAPFTRSTGGQQPDSAPLSFDYGE
jgi:hypothetical protein